MTHAEHPYHSFMLQAVELARNASWQTAPNPHVGAVLVRNGSVVASGWHAKAGEAHAEINVLENARQNGINPADCTLVVTLEPCSHFGKTPPCTDAIIKAGIKRVIIGTTDPTPHAQGGAKILQEHGIQVETGVARQECEDLIADFLTWQFTAYPYLVLKLASTLDGKIATRTGDSQWITAECTRQRVHQLRSRTDAVLVGGKTFFQDNPQLTNRMHTEPDAKQPLAAIITSHLPKAPFQHTLITQRPHDTLFFTTQAAAHSPTARQLKDLGVRVIGLTGGPATARSHVHGSPSSSLSLHEALQYLRNEANCHYVLCEGGGQLGLSLLGEQLVHEFHLHMAPKILGDNQAVPLFSGRSVLTMSEALSMRTCNVDVCFPDILLTLRPQTYVWQSHTTNKG